MLQFKQAFSSFSVKDLEGAKRFYGQTLGLEVTTGAEGVLELHVRGQDIIIYPKSDHLAATFTVLNFTVAHLAAAVRELSKLGVVFEKYDLPGIQTGTDGIFRDGDRAMAWFKDPDGNVIGLIEN
ncbi:VOC family protein [Flavobacterium kingsejongi]|uniref:VOC domain-containing protein n=1 Tax=Flavobacterium kingsejongi TaxID=1678728 RepID=A0A2S1LNI7_9FLAO|nr:VOC family protein [Flavobacterium kingsejongi]AWG25279.1 hypothetical protein FK004_08540 [Flavobacterium kingsejongi]